MTGIVFRGALASSAGRRRAGRETKIAGSGSGKFSPLWVWQWCKWIKPAQSIALFIIGLAMFAYFAGVYALAQIEIQIEIRSKNGNNNSISADRI